MDRRLFIGYAALAACMASGASAAVPTTRARPGAWVVAVSGDATSIGGASSVPLRNGAVVREFDVIETGLKAEVLLRFSDGAQTVIRPNSRIEVAGLMLSGAPEKRNKHLKITKGGLRYLTGKLTRKSAVRFTTATATIGIRGTDLEIAVTGESSDELQAGTVLKVNSGAASLDATDGSSVDVQAGEWAQGTEPELTPKGGGKRRPAARPLSAADQAAAAKLLGSKGKMDALLKR